MSNTNGTQALAKTPSSEVASTMVLGTDAYRGALEPQGLNDALKLAEMMASIGYCGVTSAPEALGRIMTGRGLGLSAMQAMRGIYSVHGRPGVDAALMHALCLQSPLCEYFDFVPEESDDMRATFVAKRRGRPEKKLTFTIEDAERMGVVDRGKDEEAKKDNNWNKNRKAMLRARAKSELARIQFPDVIFGMYSKEELEAGFHRAESLRDPNEITAEILSTEEAAAEAAKGNVVQVAPRDFAKEVAAFKERIKAAKTRAERAAVREEIAKWDAVDPWKREVSEFYNANKPVPAAAAGTATNPAPIPEGGLFNGNGETKEEGKP